MQPEKPTASLGLRPTGSYAQFGVERAKGQGGDIRPEASSGAMRQGRLRTLENLTAVGRRFSSWIQVCWIRETSKSCRTPTLQDQGWPPLPYTISNQWKNMSKALTSAGHSLVAVQDNLIDVVWTDRPERPSTQLRTLGLEYTGVSWQDKITTLRGKMTERKISWFVVTALDEIAWLFNLRGADIHYNPVFFAYAIVGMNSIRIECIFFMSEFFPLASIPAVRLFVDLKRLSDPVVRDHLQLDSSSLAELSVQTFPYESVFTELQAICAALGPKDKVWICDKASCALTQVVPKAHRTLIPYTPLCLSKAVKNATEIKGMKMAHIKDAVALCELFAWLEKEIPNGNVTEISAADKAEELRSQQKDFVGLSFPTISSVGPNGAIIHYRPLPETNRTLTVNEAYLIDSGAQYIDGTTDVTRTVHFGTPSAFEKVNRFVVGKMGLTYRLQRPDLL
ncbi:hypothetical protein CCH79_00014248 [Gambusia affinis]|uniref:Peptidase M24 domain-containing protein n=1 Tax=Gambusia affinis TaxID=33528 RepID=A0A315UU10_GAMAF|nr:hypothetical protein CCH79_00014248 [Gambusia affinis]